MKKDPLEQFTEDLAEIISGDLDIVQAERFVAQVLRKNPRQTVEQIIKVCERYLRS